jgi:hypothetical protein
MKPDPPPWAMLSGDDDAPEPLPAPGSQEAERVEAALRWRLILGRFGDDRLGLDRLDEASGTVSEPGDLSQHLSEGAAIFATLPALDVRLVLWDHRIVDVSDQVEDPRGLGRC